MRNDYALMPVGDLTPAAYNPNELSGEQQAQLNDEIRRLGRVLKPVVARRTPEGLVIIDGEQTWRAAQAAGLATVPVEVVDAVICLDHDGSAKRRYDDFLKFSYYRFANADVRNYVHQIFARTDRSRGGEVLYMKSLEGTHDVFMNVPAMWRSS